MIINKYPDGTSYVNGIGIGLHNCVFKINSYEDLWHLYQAVDAYYNYFKSKPTIIIPNLIDAQADRRFNKDESSGLKLVCQFLNSMNANFKIFHPHNSEVVEALIDNVEIIDNSKFINKVLNQFIIKQAFNYKGEQVNYAIEEFDYVKVTYPNMMLMSSDAGGFKPLMKLCDKIDWKGEVYSASKSRDKETGKLTQLVDREDFRGKDILIVDDISVYGGTFKGLSKLLKERNCGKLYLAVSHMTIQDIGEDNVCNYFDKVFTTDSKYDKYYYNQSHNKTYKDVRITPTNLEIINLFKI